VVTAVLDSLVQQQASGVLEIDGNPGGGIYFDQGLVTFAWASWAPDLATRLRGAVGPAVALPYLGPGGDRAESDFGAALVQRRLMTRDGLGALLRSAVLDAFIVLTVPLGGETSFADIRFEAPGAHWAGEFCRLRVDTVRAEAARTAQRLARYRLSPGTPVRPCHLTRPSAVVSRRQWAIVCKIGEAQSAGELAWRHGLALYEAMDCVGDLVRAGLCAPDLAAGGAAPAYTPARMAIDSPAPAAGPATAAVPAMAPGPVPAPGLGAPVARRLEPELAPPLPPLPAPTPLTPEAADATESAGVAESAELAERLPAELLQRVLGGLKKL
jgi:hypothetical protein